MDSGTATIEPDPMDSDPAHEPSEGLPPPFAPPTPPNPPKTPWWQVRVARDDENKKVGGVIAGICRAYGFDVKTTRIAVAIFTLIFPATLALYVAALILLPDRFEDAKPLRDVVTDRHRMPLVIVIGIIVAAAIAGSFGTWFVFGGFGWGFVLIALGIVLWAVPNLSFRKSQQEPAVGGLTASTPSTASTASTFATTPQRTTTPQWTTPQATTRQESVDVDHGVSRVATERRRRFPIGAVAFLVATTVAIFASIGDLLNWWDTNVFAVTLTVLIILAVGMIASVAINQFWLAAPFALLFIGMIVFLLVARPNLNGGIGEHLVTPVTATEASRHQQLAMGRITLDLTEVPLAGQSIATSAEVGLGELHVRVPDTAELRLDTRIGAGVLTLDTKNLTRGIRQEDQRTVEPAATGATEESEHGTITLHLEVGAGSIRIERVHS